MLRDILKLIITGEAHSGTTICKDILRQSRYLDSGFECGILSSPGGIKRFLDFYPYPRLVNESWGLEDDELEEIVGKSDDLETFYRRLRAKSRLIKNKECWLIDKTPYYITYLQDVILATEDIPIVITIKDPKNLIVSLMRRGCSYEKAKKRYHNAYVKNKELISNSSRIEIVQFENFVENPMPIIKKIHDMIEVKFIQEDYKATASLIIKPDPETYKNPQSPEYKPTLSGHSEISLQSKNIVLTNQQINEINKEFSDFVVV